MPGLSGEEALLPRVAQGDESAVAACLDRYGGLVWSLARRFSSSTQDAEDASQEIFLEIWRNAARFRPELGTESVFVSVLARRRLIDRIRGEKPTTEELPAERLVAPTIDPARQLEHREQVAEAVQVLAELPADQRRVIELAVCQSLPHVEIARVTGQALGTVKTHIRRGLLKIRDRITRPPLQGPKPVEVLGRGGGR